MAFNKKWDRQINSIHPEGYGKVCNKKHGGPPVVAMLVLTKMCGWQVIHYRVMCPRWYITMCCVKGNIIFKLKI